MHDYYYKLESIEAACVCQVLEKVNVCLVYAPWNMSKFNTVNILIVILNDKYHTRKKTWINYNMQITGVWDRLEKLCVGFIVDVLFRTETLEKVNTDILYYLSVLTLWSRPLRSRCRPSPSCQAEVPAGPQGEDGSGEGVTAVCSPWWTVVRGLSQGRTVHSGEGRRVAPSDESRLIHWSLLEGRYGEMLGLFCWHEAGNTFRNKKTKNGYENNLKDEAIFERSLNTWSTKDVFLRNNSWCFLCMHTSLANLSLFLGHIHTCLV